MLTQEELATLVQTVISLVLGKPQEITEEQLQQLISIEWRLTYKEDN